MSGKPLAINKFSAVIFVAVFFTLGLFVNSANAQNFKVDAVIGEWRLRTGNKIFKIKFEKDGDGLKGSYYETKQLKSLENVFFSGAGRKSYIRFQISDYGYFDLRIITHKKCEGTVTVFQDGRRVASTMTK